MKLIGVVAVVVAGGLLFSACGGKSDEDRAQAYAITACNISTDEGGEPVRDSSGNVSVDTGDSAKPVNIDSDAISIVQKWYDTWAKLTSSAQAAAKLDTSWSSLAGKMTDRAGQMSVWLGMRKSGQRPSDVSRTVASDMDRANALRAEWISECSGLAMLLSD
jgi:hypothetical protein